MTRVRGRGRTRYQGLIAAGLVLVGLGPCESFGSGGFTDAEPIGARQIVLLGDGDAEQVIVRLNRRIVPVVGRMRGHGGERRTYLKLGQGLASGDLEIITPKRTFTREIVAKHVEIAQTATHPISELIYGVAHPPGGVPTRALGARLARQGGNAASLYNPMLNVTNAGADWFYTNRVASAEDPWAVGPLDAFVAEMKAQGIATLITLPALGWVAKDGQPYAFSQEKYGSQLQANPHMPDAGNGIAIGDRRITWNQPRDYATTWGPDDNRRWLAGLEEPPDFVSVDNEMDICSQTHQAIHPEPMTYDEMLSRFTATASAIKDASPTTSVVGPASCCWWYYWNSAAGEADKLLHGGVDFLPWFLSENARYAQITGERLLDVLDVHFYPEEVRGDDIDAGMRARRLRSTRSLWDWTYTAESWIGEDEWATQSQPSRNQIALIPRFKKLIESHFPGTKFAITEWNWGGEMDISGGLAVADVLGIFGREDLYMASYFNHPPEGSFAAAAFSLFAASEGGFARWSLPVDAGDADHLGLYAAVDDNGLITVAAVNKHPTQDFLINTDDLPSGTLEVRHFSEGTGPRIHFDGVERVGHCVLVPAYSAALFTITADGRGFASRAPSTAL